MSDPRNSIDAWLNAEVEPLAPPPGTFERVRRRARRHKGNRSLNANSGTKVTPPTSSLSPGGSGNPVPANFQPTSVTFIGPHIGAVIGQAGTPGHCATAYCTSLAGTSDYGTSWYGVSAPLTGPPSGALGVSQI